MRLHTIALALATVGLTVPAVAAETEPQTVAVRYTDIDLASAEGLKQLDNRLERAARDVCGMDEAQVGSRIPSGHSRDCYRVARRNLDQQLAQLVSRKTRG